MATGSNPVGGTMENDPNPIKYVYCDSEENAQFVAEKIRKGESPYAIFGGVEAIEGQDPSTGQWYVQYIGIYGLDFDVGSIKEDNL